MKTSIIPIAILAITALVIAAPVLADSADFLTKAQAWYDKNCTKKNVNQQKSLLCYVFDKVQEHDVQLAALTARIEALEGTASPAPTPTGHCSSYVNDSQPIVVDDFNGYSDGPVVGQGGWESYVNGDNFIVQGAVVNEGAKALRNNAPGDSVATKLGTPRADGKQAVCIRTENRSDWGFYKDGNAQFRVTKNSWAGGTDIFTAVSFKGDGNVAHFDPVSGVYQNFASYNDSEWTLLETEWRSSDKMARYRINSGAWTAWKTFKGAASFTDFDYVGFDFVLPSGSGGAYFDTLQ